MLDLQLDKLIRYFCYQFNISSCIFPSTSSKITLSVYVMLLVQVTLSVLVFPLVQIFFPVLNAFSKSNIMSNSDY